MAAFTLFFFFFIIIWSLTCIVNTATALSPHLKFGTLSPRLFYDRLSKLQQENPKIKASSPPESLAGQLLWRDFYHLQQAEIVNFHQIRGNRICKDLDWRLKDRLIETNTLDDEHKPRPDRDEEAEKHLKDWTNGTTGYPWIDAIMRQLKTEGWIHHLARHSVACFLTRGHLYISWERGAEVFDDLLIDWDPSLNAGNWMWLSASAYFHQYFRVYSPIQFGKKYDPNGDYIRHFCPELKEFPAKFIYQPWEAPISVQRKANCLIGKDYPAPIVNEKEAKESCLKKMKEGYEKNRYGIDLPHPSSSSSPSNTGENNSSNKTGRTSRNPSAHEAQPKNEPGIKRKNPRSDLNDAKTKGDKQLKLDFKSLKE